MLLFPCYPFLSPQPASPKAAALHMPKLALCGEALAEFVCSSTGWKIFFHTLCPMGPMAGKWPFHQFPPSVGECVSASKAAVAGPGAQAFPGLHGARTVPGGPGDSQRSCESPAQHLHVDIFYLRGL